MYPFDKKLRLQVLQIKFIAEVTFTYQLVGYCLKFAQRCFYRLLVNDDLLFGYGASQTNQQCNASFSVNVDNIVIVYVRYEYIFIYLRRYLNYYTRTVFINSLVTANQQNFDQCTVQLRYRVFHTSAMRYWLL